MVFQIYILLKHCLLKLNNNFETKNNSLTNK